MRTYKMIATLMTLSLLSLSNAYCDDKTEKENKEQIEKVKAMKESFKNLFKNMSEIKKTVVNNYNEYENKKGLKQNKNIVEPKKND